MQLRERQINGISIIDVSDDRPGSIANPEALRQKVTELLLRGENRILLNVENLHQIDSTTLGEIVQVYKMTTSNGAILKLAQMSSNLGNLLRTTALDKVLDSYDTEDEALASLAKTPALEPGRTVISASSLWSDK